MASKEPVLPLAIRQEPKAVTQLKPGTLGGLGPGVTWVFFLFARYLGGLHGTSFSPRGGVHGTRLVGGAHGTSFITLPLTLGGAADTGVSFLVATGLEADTGEGSGFSIVFGGSLFLGGRPRPRLGGVAVSGSDDDCLVGVAQADEAELTQRESLSETSESELRLNF